MKKCIRCGKLKPLSDYSNRTDSKDGHSNRCKECDRINSKKYRSKTNAIKKEKALKYHIDYSHTKKICKKCGKEKTLSEYYIKIGAADGHSSECKSCRKKSASDLHYKNREKNILRQRGYYNDNKEHIKKQNTKHYIDNKEKRSYQMKQYREINRVKLNHQKNKYIKDRRSKDLSYLAKCRLKGRIKEFFRAKGQRKSESSEYYLGCTYDTAIKRLNSLGYEKNMHIDHIVPLSVFDGTIEYHKRIMFHFLNLQPLSVISNLRKSDILTTDWKDKIIQICNVIEENPDNIITHIENNRRYYENTRN